MYLPNNGKDNIKVDYILYLNISLSEISNPKFVAKIQHNKKHVISG